MAAQWQGAGGIKAEEYHMTLAFLGATEAAERERFMERAGALRAASFTLRLERLSYWRRAGVVVWEPAEPPPGCLWLAEQIRGWAVDRDRNGEPYRPHVTVARRQTMRPGAMKDLVVDWLVRDFVLVRSDANASPRYTVLARWPLL